MEYPALIQLRALSLQARAEQAKLQEVMLKKVIVDPVTNACEVDDQKDGACMALIYSMRNPGRPGDQRPNSTTISHLP